MKAPAFFVFAILLSTSIFSNDNWDDLNEGTKKIYGSEKEAKYDINAHFWERENWENHYSNQVLWLYKHTNYPKYRSTYFFPFYNFLESKIDNRKKFRIFNFFYKQKNSEIERFFFPFVYYYYDKQNTSESIGIFPFFYNSSDDSKPDRKSTIFLSPIYFSKKIRYELNSNTVAYTKLNFSPFHFFLENSKNDFVSSTRFFPIIPIFYHHSEPDYTHTNILWLFGKTTRAGTLRSLYALPFFFWDKSENGFLHIPPLFIFNTWNTNDESYYHSVLFFYFSYGNKFEKTFFGPIFYHHEFGTKSSNLIANFYWSKDSKTDEFTLNIFPFIYYKRNSHFAFLPFYYSSWGNPEDTEEKTYFGPFYYLKSSRDLQIQWVLFYHNYSNSKTGNSSFTVFPFFHKHENKEDKVQVSVSPFHYFKKSEQIEKIWMLLYYSHENFRNKTSFYTIFPLLYVWKNSKTEGNIFLPFYLNYKEDNNSLHLNIAGFSIARQFGTLYANASVGRNFDKTYFDFEIIAFYNLFSFSTRKSFKSEYFPKQKKGNSSLPYLPVSLIANSPKDNENQPKIEKEKSISKEKSENFWGWSALFGIAAYEKADTKRHIRVLPLGWFSWDKESDNKVFFLPLFNLWYVSDEVEYKVIAPLIIPLYAKQRNGNSFTESFLAIGYIREFNEKTKITEHSFLWPISNFYTSDDTGGSRILPFYWYKRISTNNSTQKLSLSLLHYYNSVEDKDSKKWSIHFPSFLPLISILQHTEINFHENRWWLFPIFYTKKTEDTNVSKTVSLSPIFYYEMYQIHSKDENSKYNALWILLYYHSKVDTMFPMKQKITTTLTPLYYLKSIQSDSKEDTSLWIFPFFFHDYSSSSISEREEHYSFFYYKEKSYGNFEKEKWQKNLLWILPYYHSYNSSSDFASDTTQCVVSIFPINYYFYEKVEEKELIKPIKHHYYKETFQITNLLFHYSEKYFNKDKSNYSNIFFFPIVPLFFRSISNTDLHYNIFWLMDWKKDYEKNDLRLFFFGFYIYSSEEYSRQNFLYLIDHQSWRNTNTQKLKFFLGTIHFESAPNYRKFKVLFGLLAGYESRDTDGYYDINFLWLRYLNEREEHIKLNLIPFLYYDRTSTENLIVVPPLLYYSFENNDRLLQLGGLGVFWYRNYNKRKEEETKAILLGSIYYETRLKERGYKSKGSLWGILWEYQTETETDYSKFSIFKFLYSNTTTNGKNYNRIFGVKL
ncbi:MAG: hypothetical protein HS129_00620 [Leptospiraceae bacterium]|nr:hypothetical protein [Leptospiraceae bacterium]